MLVVMDSIIHPVFILSPYQYEVRLFLTTHAAVELAHFLFILSYYRFIRAFFLLTE